MKLFWKLFFTTMLVTILCVELTGSALIALTFRDRLGSRADSARELGLLLSQVLMDSAGKRSGTAPERLTTAARTLELQGVGRTVNFALLDSTGQVLFSSLPAAGADQLPGADNGSWTLQRQGPDWYIQALCPLRLEQSLCYLETRSSVSDLVADQRGQHLLLARITCCTILPVGLVIWLISRRMTRPLGQLTQAALALADLPPKEIPGDETAQLTAGFHRMAARITEQMTVLREEAERKDRFVAAFSHELKTPMTSIIGYADLLRRQDPPPELRQKCAGYIFTEGKRLEHLSMGLLELFMIRRSPLQRRPVRLQALVRECAEALAPLLEQDGIRLQLNAEPALVSLEPVLMTSVLRNLMDNGRKAMEPGGTLTVTGRLLPTGYLLTVADTGRGMTAAEAARADEPFFMADRSRSRRQGGAGLGLALCREILDLHGFSLTLDSAPGQGTRATVFMKEVLP